MPSLRNEIDLQIAILRSVDLRHEFTTVEVARRVAKSLDSDMDRPLLEYQIERHLMARDDVELSCDRGGASWRFRPPHPDA